MWGILDDGESRSLNSVKGFHPAFFCVLQKGDSASGL